MTGEKWQGDTCSMCNGTGRYYAPVTEPDGLVERVVGYAATDRACPACNGHGREAS